MMLAIIIPYYKLTFFEATLDSLAAQTNQRFKVYIGDDAGPESPTVLLEKYKGKFDFEYYRFEGNLGGTSLTQQWERCIALSSNEEWIMILGDDDVLGGNVVEAFYANVLEIEKEGINVVRFASQVIDGEGKAISDVFKQPKLEKAVDAFWRKYIGETRSSLSEYIFSRKSFQMVKFKEYPLGWHSDDMAWLEFSNLQNLFTINVAKLWIRVSESSISGREDNKGEKSKASKLFYYSISDQYLSYFTKDQKLKLISLVEKDYFKNKKFSLFLKIFKWHILNTDLLNLIKFFRRIDINS